MVKRKVARIGPSTLMISLPSKWCKHFNIQKGAELEVEEQGSEIRVRTNENKALMETTINIEGLSERSIKYLLGAANKVGYDIINIIHESNQINAINKLFKDFYIGFIIDGQTGEKTTFKKISAESESEFDNILRRVFLVTLTLADTFTTLSKNKEFHKLKDSLMLEVTNNQLTDHCHRLLIRFGYKDYIKTSFLYTIAWNLEKIADEYKDLINYIVSINNLKLNEDLIRIAEDINNKFKLYYELFYKFKIDDMDRITSELKQLKEYIIQIETKLTKEETPVYAHLLTIAKRIGDFSSSIVAVNLH